MLDRFTKRAWWSCWGVNFACAVQPRPFNKMPGIVDVCDGLIQDFLPEHIRVVQLAPGQWGGGHSELTTAEVDSLRALDVEVLSIDARRNPSHPAEPGNVRILADFFDFS